MYDPQIEKHKTVIMQRIQQAASRGYCFYISGSVSLKKVQGFASKIAEKYNTDANENRRSYRRRLKQANSFLFLYPKKESTDFFWWILATEGGSAVHELERLISVHDKHQRLKWAEDYELIVLPKEGAKPVFTWRMTRACYQSWNDRIRTSIRQRYTDDKARQALWSLARVPGFSGVRVQAKRLVNIFESEWHRARGKTEEAPSIKRIGYVRGLPSDSVPLSLVVKRMNRGVKPFPRKDAKDLKKTQEEIVE